MELSDKNISKAVEEVEEFFEKAGVSRKDKIKISLMIEEALIRFQERFGEKKVFKITKKKWFNEPKVIVRIKGEAFNPLDVDDDEDNNFLPQSVMKNLLNYESAGANYKYSYGYNELNIFSKKEYKPLKIPGGKVTIATAVAVIAAFVVKFLFPQHIQYIIVENIVTPLFQTLMGLILAVNIPLIFISIMASICAMDDISTLNESGSKIIKRFFIIMLGIVTVSVIVSSMFFPVLTFEGETDFSLNEIVKLFLSIIPRNIIQPFLEGNVMQIVFIAFLVSSCIVIFGDRTANLKEFINEARGVVFKMMDVVLKTLPLTIFLIVFKTVLTTEASEILSIWKIVAAAWLIYFINNLLMLMHHSIKYKESISSFLKKISPTLLVAATTASGSASMAINFDVCKKRLKINEKLCDFWIPLSHSLLSPGSPVQFTVYLFFAAFFSDVTINVMQLPIVAFIAIQLGLCVPKVNGGSIAVLTLLLNQFSLSLDAIGAIVVADIFINNVGAFSGMLIRDCEIFDVSHEVSLDKAKA